MFRNPRKACPISDLKQSLIWAYRGTRFENLQTIKHKCIFCLLTWFWYTKDWIHENLPKKQYINICKSISECKVHEMH